MSLKCPPGLLGRCIAVHVDNARDIANKVSLLIFRAGKATAVAGGAAAAEEAGQAAAAQLTVLKTVEVESRHAGWILCFLTDAETSSSSAASHQHQQQQQHNILRVEIRGPDNTVRLRQVKLIGKSAAEDELAGGGALLLGTPVVHLPNRAESARIQQANCEAETLRVFRLITSQVFGKLLEPDAEAENPGPGDQWNGTDLKQHVVGILFSRWVH